MARRLYLLLLALGLLGIFSIIYPLGSAKAVTGSEWRAGRIIDDQIFTNKDAMSAQQIQAFLNQNVGVGRTNGTAGVCDTNGTQPSELGGGTRAQYGAANGNPAPFTCLKDYWEVPKLNPGPGVPANNYGGAPIPAGAKSAAQLIWDAAQAYNISPKVLLVTIQKESAGPLVTDDWPFRSQYTYAMGAHCPDSGPNHSANCDPNYAGFSIQIAESAGLLRWYLDNMNQPWWSYKKPGNNTILYHPDADRCGSSNVFIEGYATAALYTYTPYQPNATALNNLYGSQTDGCSSYGNRNFWRMYNDWFGSTLAPTYDWQLTGQYAFTDQTKTTPIGLANLAPGQRAYIGFTAKNMGNQTWSNSGSNPVNVGTVRPLGRNSPYFDPTWLGPNRPGRLKEASVAPGQTGTFEFWITAPYSGGGNINEYFGLVAENAAWMPDIGMYFATSVQPATYTWQLTGQYAFTDQTKTVGESLINLEPGDRIYVGLTAKNTGNVTWTNNGPNPVDLGITNPMDRFSPFFEGTWLGQNRPARLKEASVAPGQTGTFEFWMNVPNRGVAGNFYEYYNLVMEGRAWMRDIGLNFFGSVVRPQYTWSLTGQYAFTDHTKTTGIGLNRLSPGQRVYIGFTARNTGNVTWHNTGAFPVDVGTFNPIDRNSSFFDPTWFGPNRPARLVEGSVAPGQVGTFEFYYKAPAQPGNYLEYFNLVAENAAWMPTIGLNFNTTVQ